MISNTKLELAWDFVNHTDRNVFLTGKAGTGKTTFLHRLKRESLKRVVVVAPTGVAAINAKGVTIHSFFQLPFGPILPENNSQNTSFAKKFSGTKINIIKSLDLLIIDEISMVRSDVLDGIDQVLRRYRDRSRPFGGVQLLMIGDLQQLSPVIKNEEWQVLKNYYSTGFFFGSNAFLESNALTVELTHIFRQESEHFIKILNEIRNNTLTEESKKELDKRYQPKFSSTENEGFITLTTHNYRADNINNRELNLIKGKNFNYKAKIAGNFAEYMFPTHSNLEFKVGAQVMFIKNDSSAEKRYFNGKIGKIVHLDKNEILVRCPNEDVDISARPETWENITYAIDAETKAITESKIGEFTQMPLRLAWAITIHKSQGLTFDKIVVDAQDAFAHGQTYVALSRCKTLDGIVLTTPISEKSIINNEEVTTFNKKTEENQPNENDLKDSRKIFQLNLIDELFSFYSFLFPIGRIVDICYKNSGAVKGNLVEKMSEIKDKGITALLKINTKFQSQIAELTLQSLPENDPAFQERFIKAISYFENYSTQFIRNVLDEVSFSSDNKTITIDIEKHLEAIEALLSIKMYCFKGMAKGFSTADYLNLRAKATLQKEEKLKTKKPKAPTSTEHPLLLEELRNLRTLISVEEEVSPYNVFTQKSLFEMCEYLPTTSKGLGAISDIGKVRLEKYGDKILKVISKYCETTDITSKPEVAKTPRINATAQTSYELFKSGKSIEAIAKERNFTAGTIEGHLSQYLSTGEIEITDLMPKDKYLELKNLMETIPFEGFGDLKNKIDDRFTYGEIRLVSQVLQTSTD